VIRTGQAENQPVLPERREERVKEGVSWWWLAPCVLALAAFPFVWRPLWQMINTPQTTDWVEAPRTPTQLGFSATHEGADWKLGWSRDALARLNALGAMLTIRDGGVERLQFLSAQDLAAGTVIYIPRTSDLSFNLKVTVANGPEIEEQIRVLGADSGDGPQLAQSVPRAGEAARQAAPAEETTALAQAEREFQPPPARIARSTAPDTALPEVPLPAAAVPQLPQTTPVAPPPPRQTALNPAPPSPAPPNPAPNAAPAAPVVRTDASPLRTVPAAWPRNAVRSGAMDIRIRVQIDVRGRVVGATPLQRTVANYPFVDSALSAARMWTFTPAVENGKPVPSESVLTFKFTP
jgi:protein TonB